MFVSEKIMTFVSYQHDVIMAKINALIFIIPMVTLHLHIFAQDQKDSEHEERIITVDYLRVKEPLNTMFRECIGAGRANEGLRADWQQQLIYVKEQCGFKYIRMHGLLSDDMGVYFEDRKGNPVYNWQYIDILYDFLLSIGMKPFVEFGFMPDALASGNKTIFWWEGNITPPKDYQKWHDLIYNLVLHFKERYGEDEVKTWYFEVWNEPNLKDIFFSGDMEDYFKLYAVAARAVKKVSDQFRTGGPATAGNGWITEFIEYCDKNDVPVDFISTHTYGVKSGFVDPDGTTGTILSSNPDAVSGEIVQSRQKIMQSARPELELHYTEWSSSYTPTDPIHDSYHQASYILDKIKNTGDAAESMSYWVFTDIFEESGPRTTPFHGGFGLINYQWINKPAFYSYQFLNRLGKLELENHDSASLACKDKNGDVQVLFWDYTITLPEDSVNNQVFYKRDLPSGKMGHVKLTIKNLPDKKYKVDAYQVGYRVNDAYTTYLDMGSPQQLSKRQVEIIRRLNSGHPVYSGIIECSADGTYERVFPLRENDVFLITLTKIF